MKYADAYVKLANFGRELLERVSSLEQGLPMIADYAKEVIGAERCSIYVHSAKTGMLWTTLADGIEKIRIEADQGIAGKTLELQEALIVNDPYHNPNFFEKIDQRSGYKTENIASVPVFDSGRRIIGVLQLLNKEGGFDGTDTRFMTFFTHYISSYLELATLFKEDQDYLVRDDK